MGPLGCEVRVQGDEGQGAVQVEELAGLRRTPAAVLEHYQRQRFTGLVQ